MTGPRLIEDGAEKMMKKGVACLVIGSLALTSCAAQNEQASSEGQTVAEGAILGTLLGAGLGAAFGGGRGAAIGAAAGAVLGTAAGGYVAEQKKKYATIEQRIAGERQIAAQATATAQSQIAASQAQLAVVDAQLNDLSRTQADVATAKDRTTTMFAGLQNQRSQLESQRKQLETSTKNQQAFIAETEKEIGPNDPQKAAQLAQWKADIPPMQAAFAAVTTQIADITTMETKVQQLTALLPDPAKGGFISGVSGLVGGYEQRVATQSMDLERMRAQQAAAESQANQAKATLAEREQSLVRLRNDVAMLDLSLKNAQAKVVQQRTPNVALSDRDRKLMSDLQSAKARLASLQQKLRSSTAADDFEATKQEYLRLQAAIAALAEQLKPKPFILERAVFYKNENEPGSVLLNDGRRSYAVFVYLIMRRSADRASRNEAIRAFVCDVSPLQTTPVTSEQIQTPPVTSDQVQTTRVTSEQNRARGVFLVPAKRLGSNQEGVDETDSNILFAQLTGTSFGNKIYREQYDYDMADSLMRILESWAKQAENPRAIYIVELDAPLRAGPLKGQAFDVSNLPAEEIRRWIIDEKVRMEGGWSVDQLPSLTRAPPSQEAIIRTFGRVINIFVGLIPRATAAEATCP